MTVTWPRLETRLVKVKDNRANKSPSSDGISSQDANHLLELKITN